MIFVIFLYCIILFAAAIGILANNKSKKPAVQTYSIVAVARNEEDDLPFLLLSLSKIDYPPELYEILLIDDGSNDDTLNIMNSMAKASKNVTVISIKEKKLPGKKAGLQAALESAAKDILLLTDADCFVEPDWLKGFNDFWDEDTDLIVGYAPEDVTRSGMRFRHFISLIAAGIYAATIGLKMPFSCAGRNLAVRRKTLLQAGGYKSLTSDAAGDDKQMLNLILAQKGKVKYNWYKSVHTQPEIKSFHDQQKRRFGVIKMSSPLYLAASVLVASFYLYLPIYLVLSGNLLAFIVFWVASLFAWAVNLIKHKETFYLADLVYILIYPYYFIFYTIAGSFGKWSWK